MDANAGAASMTADGTPFALPRAVRRDAPEPAPSSDRTRTPLPARRSIPRRDKLP